jgi:hypothetical protein
MHKNTAGQTGPKSIAGKTISSMNAIKHGGYSKKRLLPFEDAKAYEAHLKEVLTDLNPSNSVQGVAASQYADALWRVERIQVRESLTREEIMRKVTPRIVAEGLGIDGKKRELAPEYLLDPNYEIPAAELEGLDTFFKEYHHFLQNCKGMANFNMVWRQYQTLFTHLEKHISKMKNTKPLFMASREGLDLAWQQSPKRLLETMEELFYIYEYRADFESMKSDIRQILLNYYYHSRSDVHRVDELDQTQIRLIKECHYLLAQYWKLCKSQNDHAQLQHQGRAHEARSPAVAAKSVATNDVPKKAEQENCSQRNEMPEK